MSWTQAVPPAAMRWAQEAAGARVVAALPLESQWLANHLLVLGDGRELVLRRWARPGWERDDPDLTAAREALVLERLAGTPVPAPELVAADPDAAACDVPALLITRVPGAAFQGRPPVGPLAVALADIHAVDPAGIPPYRRYYEPDRLAVPTWASDRDVWERAIALAHAPPPDLPERFIHRDFHPGNTLWEGADLTGVVDWTTGSRGPAAVDLGHLRWNLALDYGQRVADALLPHPEHDPYYDVVTALDVLPELDTTFT
ncbi:MAG TPA: phosphotransferase, partial [Solirubrobacteraceae bacterium]|nr:phosphotransferase [Solirubrobacteraceae bacterium]